MFNAKDAEEVEANKPSFSKNLATDQTFHGLVVRLNTTNRAWVMDGLATNNDGGVTASSTSVFVMMGGFNDQKTTFRMKYMVPSVAGAEDIGLTLRHQASSQDVPADAAYYYLRIKNGFAQIVQVLGTTFTTLTEIAWAVLPDVWFSIAAEVYEVAGVRTIEATFTADSGPAPQTISAPDSDATFALGGLMSWKTVNTAGVLASITNCGQL
jgi:hypothetical protein